MPVTAAQLVAQVSVDGADKAKSDLASVGEQVNATSGGFKSALGDALSFASNTAGQALGFLKDQLTESVKVAMQHQQIMAQTAQAIKSTGGVAGMTAQSIGNLAESLSQVTPFSEDAIESGENLMLTFTGIGKQTFPQATQAMLDLSQATGEDMKSAALQLGKALNDPTTGLTALSRVGVSFSEAEKQSIQTMMAHNDVAGAQAVMLKELQTEFGGSAKAAGGTFAGQVQILTNTFDDLKIQIGTAILPLLSSLAGVISSTVLPQLEKFSGWFTATAGPALQQFGAFLSATVVPALQHLASNAQIMVPILVGLGAVIAAVLIPATYTWAAGVIAATWPFLAIGAAVAAVTAIFLHFYQTNAPFKDLIDNIGHAVASVGPIFQQIGGIILSSLEPAWQQLQAAMKPALPALQKIGELLGGVLVVAIGLAIGLITGLAKGIAQAISGIVTILTGFARIFSGIFTVLGGVISLFFDLFTGHWSKLGGDLKQIVSGYIQIFSGMWTVIAGTFQTAIGFVSGLVSGFVSGVKAFFTSLFDDLVGHSIIPDLITGIERWFQRLPGQALGWARDMVSNFVSGIENGVTDIGNAVSQIASTIAAHLHFSKPDVGPLVDSDQWMPDLMSTLASGMQTNLGKVSTASLSVSQAIAAPLSGGISAIPSSVSQAGGPTQIVIQAPDLYLDGQRVTKTLMPYFVTIVRNATGANI